MKACDYFWQAVRFDRLTEDQQNQLDEIRQAIVDNKRADALSKLGNFIGTHLKQPESIVPEEITFLERTRDKVTSLPASRFTPQIREIVDALNKRVEQLK
jgi:hypothetical protein